MIKLQDLLAFGDYLSLKEKIDPFISGFVAAIFGGFVVASVATAVGFSLDFVRIVSAEERSDKKEVLRLQKTVSDANSSLEQWMGAYKELKKINENLASRVNDVTASCAASNNKNSQLLQEVALLRGAQEDHQKRLEACTRNLQIRNDVGVYDVIKIGILSILIMWN